MTASEIPAELLRAAEALAAGENLQAISLAEAAMRNAAYAEAFGIAGAAYAALGDDETAAQRYRAGLAAFPHHPALAVNLARLLRDRSETVDEALRLLADLVERAPDFAPARLSLIETLRTAAHRPTDAEIEARRYVERYPGEGAGFLSLALALFDQARLSDALAASATAARLPGNQARAWELTGNIHVALGDPEGAAAAYRQVLEFAPDPDTHSRLLVALQYCESVSEAQIFDETRRWANAYGDGILPRTTWPGLDFDPERELRVGIVSGDFRLCSTPFLALPLFRHWPADWTVTLYSNSDQSDQWTTRFQDTAARWVDIETLDDDEAAARIEDDAIDVLVDLNGHTLGGRLGVFRRKPAPVQIAWLDYVGTTGLDVIDAIIADAGHLPIADQPFYAERIRHVADNLYRYLPLENAPAVSELPALRNGFITFGSFNSPYKISPSTLQRWGAILGALPTAKLVLNAREYGDPDTVHRFERLFGDLGITGSRLDFRPGAADPIGMLAAYQEIDIALDTFPYSGGLTTLEGLFMGVPVVTMPGARFGSRHSSVHLRTVGLTDWIARNSQSYVELAVRKADAVAELAGLRATLRSRLIASPLCDGSGLARDVSRLVRELWRAACQRNRKTTQPFPTGVTYR